MEMASGWTSNLTWMACRELGIQTVRIGIAEANQRILPPAVWEGFLTWEDRGEVASGRTFCEGRRWRKATPRVFFCDAKVVLHRYGQKCPAATHEGGFDDQGEWHERCARNVRHLVVEGSLDPMRFPA
jgi:hypothetical protein